MKRQDFEEIQWLLNQKYSKVVRKMGEYGYDFYGFCLKYYQFKFAFSRYNERVPFKIIMTYNNLENQTFVSITKTCLLILPDPSKTWKLLGCQQLYQINKEGHLLTGTTLPHPVDNCVP